MHSRTTGVRHPKFLPGSLKYFPQMFWSFVWEHSRTEKTEIDTDCCRGAAGEESDR